MILCYGGEVSGTQTGPRSEGADHDREDSNMGDQHLTTQDLAKRWGMTAGHLANLRSEGSSPVAYIKFGNRCMYRLCDVVAFEEANLVAAAA